jgi:predicted AlkP superfamily pyrophosphatase or phosphodiesterase
MIRLALLSSLLLAIASATPDATAGKPLAEHVVVIGLDGCRPEAIEQAAGPVLKKLWQEGAWTFHAQTALPSVTHVNFAGILTGSSPQKHGIDSKEWVTGNRLLKVKAPTIFDVVAKDQGQAGGFLGHEKLYPAEGTTEGTYFEHSPYESNPAAKRGALYIKEKKPRFCFIYMGDLDGAGHKYGWLSTEQLAKMSGIDAAIGIVLSALRDTGLLDTTLVIVTADHGGHGRMHSTGTPEDTTVPWIASGPMVKPGQITATVHNYDTSATAAHALSISPPAEWDGRAVLEAFAVRAK